MCNNMYCVWRTLNAHAPSHGAMQTKPLVSVVNCRILHRLELGRCHAFT